MRRIKKYVSIMAAVLTIASSCPMVTYANEVEPEEDLFSEIVDAETMDEMTVEQEDIFDDPAIPEEVWDIEENEEVTDTTVTADGTPGDIANPMSLELNTETEGNCGSLLDVYYTFTVEKVGYIQPFLKKTTSKGGIDIEVYAGSPVNKTLVFYNDTNKQEYQDLGISGLRPGSYTLKLHFSLENMGYALKINFVESDNYEEEPDSKIDIKKISLGQYYFGSCTPLNGIDIFDYYCFDLPKKTKVTVSVTTSGGWGTWDVYAVMYGPNQKSIKGEWGESLNYSVECEAGTNYLKIFPWSYDIGQSNLEHLNYKFIITEGKSSSSKTKKEFETGSATVNGEKYKSLKDAFKAMKEKKDYVVDLETDMIGEPSLTIPKNPTSVTINGNGKMIKIIGSTFTSNTNLKLNDVTIRTENKKGAQVKLTLNAKNDLETGAGVKLDALKPVVKVGKTFRNEGDFNANSLTVGTLDLAGTLTVNKDDKVTVKTNIKSVSGNIVLGEGFNKPIVLQGTVEEGAIISITGSKFSDGTQILKTNQKKIDPAKLASVFNVSGITDNTVSSHLYYLKSGCACIFGDSIIYNGAVYGIWKDAVTKMNADIKAGTKELNVSLVGDANAMGALTMPKSGYDSLTISAAEGQHKLIFTGDIKVTGNTAISDDVILTKVNKKGEKVAGKVVKSKKYTYMGKDTF